MRLLIINFILFCRTLNQITENHVQSIFAYLKWQPIKIHYYMTQQTQQNQILNQILDLSTLYFYKTLQIRKTYEHIDLSTIDLRMQLNQQDEIYFKEKHQEYDLFIFVGTKIIPNYLAITYSVNLDKTTKRPNVCELYLNTTFHIPQTDLDYQQFLKTIIHETIHCLVFSQDVYPYFYDFETGGRQQNIIQIDGLKQFLVLNRTQKYLQFYFNCNDIKGIELETEAQNSTKGLHFENTIFWNQIMQEITSDELKLSQLIFIFLQETGFYQLSEYEADQTFWGQNKGCDFLNQQCQNQDDFEEFCDKENQRSCTFTHSGIGICKASSRNKCKFYQQIEGGSCRNVKNKPGTKLLQHYGYDSICVKGSLSKNNFTSDFSCQQYQCDVNDHLIINVGSLKLNCSQQSLLRNKSLKGQIECPSNSRTLCRNQNDCPNHCSQKGICVNKECICQIGFSGQDCQQVCTGYRYKGLCLEKCELEQYTYESIKYCVGCPGNCISCIGPNQCIQCKDNYELRSGFCQFEFFGDLYDKIILLTILNVLLFM